MITDTRAIVLRQVRTINSRRVISLFTEEFGKIAAGVTVSERGKGKASLALRPFAYGNYELFKSRDFFNLNKGQVIKSFYGLGQDVDRYMAAARGMELLDKVLPEWQPSKRLFDMTVDFLTIMEERKNRFDTVLRGFEAKVLMEAGFFPDLTGCVSCGKQGEAAYLSVPDGGILCGECGEKALLEARTAEAMQGLKPLIFKVDSAIIDILVFYVDHPLTKLAKLALTEDMEVRVGEIMDGLLAYHLDLERRASDLSFSVPRKKEE